MQLQAAYIFVMAALAAAFPLIDVRVTAVPAKAGVDVNASCMEGCWVREHRCPPGFVCCALPLCPCHLYASRLCRHNLPSVRAS